MHPLNTHQRRQLLAACLRIERRLRRKTHDNHQGDRKRIAKLMRGGKPFDETTV